MRIIQTICSDADRIGSGYELHIGVLPELARGQSIPRVFHWNDHGTRKEVYPKALYHRWKVACRLAGVPRSVAMKLTGHKTEAVYRRYAIACEADLADGLKKLARLEQALRRKSEFSHTLENSESKTSYYWGKFGGGGEI